MTRQVEATPDQVLAVLGGVGGGALVMAAWWFLWRIAGGKRAKRIARCACGMVTRGRDVAHPLTTDELAAAMRTGRGA